MKESLQLLDVVALLEDHPEAGLVAGKVRMNVGQYVIPAIEPVFIDANVTEKAPD